jgi:hypothetical protein
MIEEFPAGRRDVLAAALAVVGSALFAGAAHAGQARDESDAADPVFGPHAHDWDWLIGNWSVRHRRLRERLAGNTTWDEFAGTCRNWPLMGGRGNVDDNVLELPAGRYRGVGVRAFDVQTRLWSIWWIDSRTPGIEPPVRGGFENGVGTFIGDDSLRGRPVKVRFRWSEITATSATWEQSFSPDGGASWEMNWHMDFTRTA